MQAEAKDQFAIGQMAEDLRRAPFARRGPGGFFWAYGSDQPEVREEDVEGWTRPKSLRMSWQGITQGEGKQRVRGAAVTDELPAIPIQ